MTDFEAQLAARDARIAELEALLARALDELEAVHNDRSGTHEDWKLIGVDAILREGGRDV